MTSNRAFFATLSLNFGKQFLRSNKKNAFLDTPHGNAFLDTPHGDAFYVGMAQQNTDFGTYPNVRKEGVEREKKLPGHGIEGDAGVGRARARRHPRARGAAATAAAAVAH